MRHQKKPKGSKRSSEATEGVCRLKKEPKRFRKESRVPKRTQELTKGNKKLKEEPRDPTRS